VNWKKLSKKARLGSALGTAITVLCGLALWRLPMGERWVNASYDYLFRFGARAPTNQVVVVLMDNEAHAQLGQERGHWDRNRHAQLLNKLADDGCRLVVLDIFFGEPREPSGDQALAEALRRLRRVALMAKILDAALRHEEAATPSFESVRPQLPCEPFLSAAGTNWGIALLDPDLDSIVRRHWPFGVPAESFPSLPWTAARLEGAGVSEIPQKRWLRYYYGLDVSVPWTSLPYHVALTQGTNYFRDKIVFIGSKPETSVPGNQEDKFRTPYTRWTGEAVGGVEINATAFLNLINGEWLQRPAGWLEALGLCAAGALFSAGLARFGRLAACGLAAGGALAFTLAAVSFSYYTNYWFPWLVVVGGQVPCALAWALLAPQRHVETEEATREDLTPGLTTPASGALTPSSLTFELPDAPDYEFFDPPFAEGAYGRVWLARNAVGQWQALKAVYLAKFGAQSSPYDREFNGIRRYKPVSDKHPGLLRVDFVSIKKPSGYFYYVMELGDALEPGWQSNPSRYVPGDLAKVRSRAPGRRLPAGECLRIVTGLAEALEFLHQQGLTHRDIKPQNIIFVNNRPKLADVGLVAEVWPPDKEKTWVGTPSYMPPPPEPPGTPRADIYGLGMVFYVILTGHDPAFFPELATTLGDETHGADVRRLTSIVLKACQPDLTQRYGSASEMLAALVEAKKAIDH
jgi:CHASE2 domain-containing sensor protein